MTNKYIPDKWVVVEITSPNDDEKIQRVLAGWSGGYLHGDSWKLSSGIIGIEEFDDRYEFKNHSGSIYICYKSSHGMTGMMAHKFSYFKSQETDDVHINLTRLYSASLV